MTLPMKETYGLKSLLLSALHNSLYVCDSVVNSILNQTVKMECYNKIFMI